MRKMPRKSLVIDVSNILFRVSAAQMNNPYARDADTQDLVGLCFHISLFSILKYYNKFKPDYIVFAFEGENNWRKTYTTKNKSRIGYKSGRVVDPKMIHFYKLMIAFKEVITNHTSICCLSVKKMEADDSIAAYCQLYASNEHNITIISGDKDFTQLLKLPNVKLINPDNGKERNTPNDKEYEPDIDYWMFKKCVRGDAGDSVPSAYPRVREVKIKKAYEDQYSKLNFMNEEWNRIILEKDENGVMVEVSITHKVGDLFEENCILMDLSKQPKELRIELEDNIKKQVNETGTYSHFHFLRFLGEYNLQKVSEESMKFVELFANNQRFLKNEKQQKTPDIIKDENKSSNLLTF